MTEYNTIYIKLPKWIDPEQAFRTFFANERHAFWLDSSMIKQDLSRFSYMGLPSEIITYSLPENKLTVQKGRQTKHLTQDIFFISLMLS